MTSLDPHCPACNARVGPAAEWCTLCYADLRPAPEPPLAPAALGVPALSPYGEQVAPAATGAAGPAGLDAIQELVARGVPADDEARVAEAAELMLAQLAAESAVPLRGIAGNFSSNGAKVGLIAGGSIVFLIVLFALMALIGSQL